MTLKRNSTLIFLLLFCFSLAQAQWVSQWHGFISARGINHIQAVNANVVWATAFDAGNLAIPINEFTRTVNGGLDWTPGFVTGASGLQSAGIFALNPDTAWVVMQNPSDTGGYICRTNDGGLNWTRMDSAVFHVNPVFVHFWNEDQGLCIGNPYNGRFEIYTTLDGGINWMPVAANNIPVSQADEYALNTSFCVQGDTVWFGGNTYGKIFVSHDNGKHWSFLPSPISTMKKVIFYDSLSGLVGRVGLDGDSWELYETHDRGMTWSSVNASGTVNTADLAFVPGTEKTFVSVGFRMSFTNDAGSSWLAFGQPSPLTSPYFHCVNFIDPSTGWAGGMNTFSPSGGIYKYAGPALAIQQNDPTTQQFVVYPNPATENVNIFTQGFEHGKAQLSLYNLVGQEIQSQTLVLNDQDFNQLSLQGLNPGIYFLRLSQNHIVLHKELIVK